MRQIYSNFSPEATPSTVALYSPSVTVSEIVPCLLKYCASFVSPIIVATSLALNKLYAAKIVVPTKQAITAAKQYGAFILFFFV